jgi:hypothetical protein
MKGIDISKFKAACLKVLERLRETKQPVPITRVGKPVADIMMPQDQVARTPRLGTGVGSGRICGDIVGPIGDESDWEAAHDPVAGERDK